MFGYRGQNEDLYLRARQVLGPPVVPFYPFGWEASPTKKRLQRKVGTLILTSLLEDLEFVSFTQISDVDAQVQLLSTTMEAQDIRWFTRGKHHADQFGPFPFFWAP